jgi:hypothetical protein
LPYLMYAPSEMLLGSLRSALPQALMTDKAQELARSPEVNSDYNPLDSSLNPMDRFTNAITPYTLAIQIASHIATYWSLSDEYECKITTVPVSSPTPPPPAPTQPGQPATLQDVLNASMGQNASSAPRTHGDLAQVNQPVVTAQTVTQLRYQGLWWGAERIWTDELVRLKLARSDFAPQGAQAVYPPAGPSKASKEWYAENGLDVDAAIAGAGERGMFMQIDSLFVVTAPRTDGEPGTFKECRASGMLYELVEEDYEDPQDIPQHDAPPQTKGKGKERAVEFGESISTGPAKIGDSAVNSASAPVLGNTNATRDIGLSRPTLTTPFPLPDPPEGYKFHAIIPPGNECVLSLSLISGRYYPRLFKHPLLVPVVQKALQVPVEEGGIMLNKHIWAMDGLLPGAHQSMEPEAWKASRYLMLHDGDVDARTLLGQEIEQICGAEEQPEPMVVASDEPGPSGSQQDAQTDVLMGDNDAGSSSGFT